MKTHFFLIFALMWRGIKECFFPKSFTLIFPNTWCFKKFNYEVRNEIMSYTINLHTQKEEAGKLLWVQAELDPLSEFQARLGVSLKKKKV